MSSSTTITSGAPPGSGINARWHARTLGVLLFDALIRQRDCEGGTFIRLAVHRDSAAQNLAEALGDREAKASATVAFCSRGISLPEGLEQSVDLLLRHANSRIPDYERDRGSCSRPISLYIERDDSFRSEFRGVA